MSLNRRRWANDSLVSSLIDFQNRSSSELVDSLEDDKKDTTLNLLDENCTNISSTLESLDLENDSKNSANLLKYSNENSACTSTTEESYSKSERSKSPNDIMNLSMSENYNHSKEYSNESPATNSVINVNMSLTEDNCILKNQSNTTPLSTDQYVYNLNERLTENSTISSDSGTIKLSSCNSSTKNSIERQSMESYPIQYLEMISKEDNQFHYCNLNERLNENITTSSDSGTIKLSSCNSSIQNISDRKSVENQLIHYSKEMFKEGTQSNKSFNLNDRLIENIAVSEDDEGIKLTCNSSIEHVEEYSMESPFSLNVIESFKNEQIKQKLFSSPFESSKTDQELIAEIQEPDVWDALLALDQALSPVEKDTQTSEKYNKDPPHILNRLSQKFKKTPTRFTEKLVSIIEDSVVSSESPTKQYTGNTSGISLHRMTGEFRKLCKFIEDESMPEWAPSLVNMTTSYFEKTETPEQEKNIENNFTIPKNMSKHINTTPPKTCSPLKSFVTPKNKVLVNNVTPIKQFTPSADKSFEYWEKVCNMMCENQTSAKKESRKRFSVSESVKVNMDEILTICERQLASLDDSILDTRSSEPCKKVDNELEFKVTQTPRSKSVSKIYSDTNKKEKHLPIKGNEDKNINEKLDFDKEFELTKINSSKINGKKIYEDHFEELEKNQNVNLDEKEYFKDNLELQKHNDLIINLEESFEDNSDSIIYKSKEADRRISIESIYEDNEQDSLLIELAKRRQRCLDTAKLMLEIDREDPITNEDNKCLETLYKLGIQDKTFVEVEEDAKFLNTLSHCIEYQKYFKNQSKPIVNLLENLNSPNDVKSKTSSSVKSKKSISQTKPSSFNVKSHQISSLNKPQLNIKNSLKNVQAGKLTPRLIKKSLPKSTHNVERKPSYVLNSQHMKIIPKIDKKSSYSTNLQPNTVISRVISKSTSKITPQMNKKSLQPQFQQKKITPTSISKPLNKIPQSDSKSKQSTKLTPKMTQTLHKQTPHTDVKGITKINTLKVTQHTSHNKIASSSNSKKITPKMTTKLTPQASRKLTPNCDVKGIIRKETPPVSSPQILTPESVAEIFAEKSPRIDDKSTPKATFFVQPGCSPNVPLRERKKPSTYFSDTTTKNVQKTNYENMKSPISRYINGVDAKLIQNTHSRTNDRLLTPILNDNTSKSPKLKFKLSSKENESPTTNCNENILPRVRYQSAKKVRLIDDKSAYSPTSLTPNSKTKKLLEPVENTVVIRHEGRVMDSSARSDSCNTETSIRVQKMAEKINIVKKKLM